MKTVRAAVAALVTGAATAVAAGTPKPCFATPPLGAYDVVWDSPSEDSRGSMPLGNGDIGLNVWVEKSTGDLIFTISKTDAWGDNVYGDYGLPKVGRVRVRLDPSPLAASGAPFRQTLRLQEGAIEIAEGDPAHAVHLRLWVDANRPVIHVDESGAQPERVQATIDTYRTRPEHDLNADIVFPAKDDMIAWCYRNTNPHVPELTNRTFGAVVRGDGFVAADVHTLRSAEARRE
jgi:hypothetical protein